MKKVILFLFISMFLISLVYAQQGPGDGTGLEHDAMIAAGGQEGNPTAGEGIGAKIMAGNYIGKNGQQMIIQKKLNNQMQLRVNNISADCGLNLTQKQIQNKTKLETRLSNGRNAEIKIMPNTASETALQRLRLKNCVEEEGCNIELKEVGQGQQAKVAYEMSAQRQSRVFGLFGARMNVQAQVDAETGEIIRVRKPWWAFLASEQEGEKALEESSQ
jgi:hypothetical protein